MVVAHAVRVLVIQLWTIDLEPIVTMLAEVGITATITRVDFEASLDAALTHERFEVAIYDPATPGLSHETVQACLRTTGRAVPIVILDGTHAGASVLEIVAKLRN